jgi:16S rRNA (cytidine1402-2'-O)-methyltransferase
MAVVREITKKFEEVKRGHVSELISFYEENGEPKGELVLVIGRAEESHKEWTEEKVAELIYDCLKTKTARDTVDFVVEQPSAE